MKDVSVSPAAHNPNVQLPGLGGLIGSETPRRAEEIGTQTKPHGAALKEITSYQAERSGLQLTRNRWDTAPFRLVQPLVLSEGVRHPRNREGKLGAEASLASLSEHVMKSVASKIA